MIRRIIRIDEAKCNGCGACAGACHEGAIEMIGGKAKLTKENYCDGLGDCLPACPTGAITFEEREAPAYDEAAVLAAKAKSAASPCHMQTAAPAPVMTMPGSSDSVPSMLANWPVQIKLMPVQAPYLDGADLLIAADCTAYAYGSFHSDFMRGRVTVIGCPKLDAVDYAEKLGAILKANDIRSITLTRMQVPCCGGLENAVRRALADSGKTIPLKVAVIAGDGRILQ